MNVVAATWFLVIQHRKYEDIHVYHPTSILIRTKPYIATCALILNVLEITHRYSYHAQVYIHIYHPDLYTNPNKTIYRYLCVDFKCPRDHAQVFMKL